MLFAFEFNLFSEMTSIVLGWGDIKLYSSSSCVRELWLKQHLVDALVMFDHSDGAE